MSKVAKSDETLPTLNQGSPPTIVALDRQGRVTQWSRAAESVFGWSEKEVLDRSLPAIPDEHQQQFRALIERAFQGREQSALELRLLRKDGTQLDASLWASPLRDAKGATNGVLALLTDVGRRKHVQRALDESEARLTGIVSSAMDAIVSIDHDQRIVVFNAAAEKMFKCSAAEAIGQPLDRFIPPSFRAEHRAEVRKFGETGVTTRSMGRLGVVMGLRTDGEEFPLESAISQVEVGGRRIFTAILRDITERVRAEKRQATQLATAEILAVSASLQTAAPRILQSVCENLGWDVGEIWRVDPQANVLRCVDFWHVPALEKAKDYMAGARKSGFAPGVGLTGRIWVRGEPVWIPDVTEAPYFTRATEAAKADLHCGFGFPIRLGNETLGVFTFFSRKVRPPDNEQLQMFVLIGSQIGQFIHRRKAEEELRKLNEQLENRVIERTEELQATNQALRQEFAERRRLEREVLAISEREQRRIGQDIHDGVSQQLAGVVFMSKALQRNLKGRSSGNATKAGKIAALVQAAAKEVHHIARGLYPVKLEASGLMSALSELAANIQERFGVRCVFRCHAPVLVEDSTSSTHTFRIAQEAVTNAIKHGQPKNIVIGLRGTANKIVLTVENDGRAFPKSMPKDKGMGLSIMHYRASIIGATLDIKRCRKPGTVVTCTLPKHTTRKTGASK